MFELNNCGTLEAHFEISFKISQQWSQTLGPRVGTISTSLKILSFHVGV